MLDPLHHTRIRQQFALEITPKARLQQNAIDNCERKQERDGDVAIAAFAAAFGVAVPVNDAERVKQRQLSLESLKRFVTVQVKLKNIIVCVLDGTAIRFCLSYRY